MKRRDLLRYLKQHGCEYLGEDGNHTIYVNREEQKVSPIPQYEIIKEFKK